MDSSNHDNSKLISLLEIYAKETNNRSDAYKNVLLELTDGTAFLLIPSEHDNGDNHEWKTVEKGTQLKLAFFNQDGLTVLGAFTDEESLLNWAKKPTQYTGLPSAYVMQFCKDNGIDRMVINSGSPTIFVLERSKTNIKTYTIASDTVVQMGTPNRPLGPHIIQRLTESFKNYDTILEVYQYGQSKNGEFTIVLGFKLANNSEDSKTAAINAVQNALQNENFAGVLDLFFIETDESFNRIKGIQDSLIYQK